MFSNYFLAVILKLRQSCLLQILTYYYNIIFVIILNEIHAHIVKIYNA